MAGSQVPWGAGALARGGELGHARHDGLQVGVVGDALEVMARRVGRLERTDFVVAQLDCQHSGILAVYRHDMQKLADSVDELLKAHSPLDAFVTWFETLAAYIRIKHGLDQALHSAAIRSAIDESYAPVAAAVARLLDACVADGSVRPGLAADDVLLLMGFLWRLPPGDDGREQGRRVMQIVFNGILRRPE